MRHRPPRASEAYLEMLLRTVEKEAQLDADPSDPFALCSYLLRGIPNRSIVVVVGDDVEPAPDIERPCARCASGTSCSGSPSPTST